jgi:hypothetical protein
MTSSTNLIASALMKRWTCILVRACGRLCPHRKKINISTVVPGRTLGTKAVDRGIWLVNGLQSGLYRAGAKDFAIPRQPVRS